MWPGTKSICGIAPITIASPWNCFTGVTGWIRLIRITETGGESGRLNRGPPAGCPRPPWPPAPDRLILRGCEQSRPPGRTRHRQPHPHHLEIQPAGGDVGHECRRLVPGAGPAHRHDRLGGLPLSGILPGELPQVGPQGTALRPRRRRANRRRKSRRRPRPRPNSGLCKLDRLPTIRQAVNYQLSAKGKKSKAKPNE